MPAKPTRYVIKPRRRRANVKLESLRVNAGLSPNELGRRVGCSGQTIREAEKGSRPRPSLQFAIAAEFGLLPLDIWPLETRPRVRV